MRYSATNKKVMVDPRMCYGCGVCRAGCHKNAIFLFPRIDEPLASQVW
jgi:NAD-dependent dihydropyrimidine dehydrogenase PreA subunit